MLLHGSLQLSNKPALTSKIKSKYNRSENKMFLVRSLQEGNSQRTQPSRYCVFRGEKVDIQLTGTSSTEY